MTTARTHVTETDALRERANRAAERLREKARRPIRTAPPRAFHVVQYRTCPVCLERSPASSESCVVCETPFVVASEPDAPVELGAGERPAQPRERVVVERALVEDDRQRSGSAWTTLFNVIALLTVIGAGLMLLLIGTGAPPVVQNALGTPLPPPRATQQGVVGGGPGLPPVMTETPAPMGAVTGGATPTPSAAPTETSNPTAQALIDTLPTDEARWTAIAATTGPSETAEAVRWKELTANDNEYFNDPYTLQTPEPGFREYVEQNCGKVTDKSLLGLFCQSGDDESQSDMHPVESNHEKSALAK